MDRQRVLVVVVIKLLISVQQTVPAVDALFAGFKRVQDLCVVFEAFAVVEALVVTIVARGKDGVVPGAVDAGADADAVSA